jgi:hypothetical protein
MYKVNYLIIFLSLFISFTYSQLAYQLVGGVTESSFNIKAKGTTNTPISLYLNNTLYGTYNADSDLYYDIQVTNLLSNSHYDININSNGVNSYLFNVTTFPLQNQSLDFTFIATSTSKADSSSFVFDRIASKKMSFFMLLGNMHTNDKSSTNWKDYEEVYVRCNFFINFIFFIFSSKL